MSQAKVKRVDWDDVKKKLRDVQALLQAASTVDDARLHEVYRERARRLASRGEKVRAAFSTEAVLVFSLGHEAYGIPLRYIAQVFSETRFTPVPGAAAELLGVANLLGAVRSVLDLRRVLALGDGDEDVDRYILLLRQDGCEMGLRVEQIDDVRQVALDDLTTPDDDTTNQPARYVEGLTGDRLIILRTEALLQHYLFRRSQGT